MPIRKLPTLLVNQIAAGEVIERPASVVKELVENSLDAGATRIDVAIEEGGSQLIRVSDDGKGIPPDELPLAVAPHATSKLQSADQLASIGTLGFRGEALASIASVSRLRLASRAVHSGGGPDAAQPRSPQASPARTTQASAIEASGDHVSPVTPSPTPGSHGSVIEVRDLFFNTPARRKFLRTPSTEFGHISELIGRVAMVHHAVAFRLSHNGRTVLDLPAEASRARRCVAVLGKDIEEGLLEFEHQDLRSPYDDDSRSTPDAPRPTSVWGLAGVPSLARPTAKFQYLCVNGRPIKDRNLNHALREAYRGLVPPDKQPVAVIFIDLDPRAVDVNVHPTKSEVRFRNPSAVHGLVLSSIRQRLLASDLTPSIAAAGTPWTPSSFQPSVALSPFAAESMGASPEPTPASPSAFVDYFRRMDPKQQRMVFDEVKREVAEEPAPTPTLHDTNGHAPHDPSTPQAPPSTVSVPILQVHQSYVVAQDHDGLIIVDQHALHERVMFEELRRRVLGPTGSAGSATPEAERSEAPDSTPPRGALESQRLLMPAVLRADANRQAVLEELKPLLDRLGIEAEPMGPGSVAIHAFPTFLFDRNVEPEEFLSELLDRVDAGEIRPGDSTSEEATLHEVLDMMACKAAVKAGDRLTDGELAALLAKRDEIERGSACPHGRPTTIRLTLRDLERHFKRT